MKKIACCCLFWFTCFFTNTCMANEQTKNLEEVINSGWKYLKESKILRAKLKFEGALLKNRNSIKAEYGMEIIKKVEGKSDDLILKKIVSYLREERIYDYLKFSKKFHMTDEERELYLTEIINFLTKEERSIPSSRCYATRAKILEVAKEKNSHSIQFQFEILKELKCPGDYMENVKRVVCKILPTFDEDCERVVAAVKQPSSDKKTDKKTGKEPTSISIPESTTPTAFLEDCECMLTHTVKRYESLSIISKQYYGNAYMDYIDFVFQCNRDKIENIDRILLYQRICIPKIKKDSQTDTVNKGNSAPKK